MAYSDFTLADLAEKFGVKNRLESLFDVKELLEPSDFLKQGLQAAKELPARTEKAKSESIVFPIILEMRRRNDNFFTIYSGENLNADESNGLKGECDAI